jgi:hypothetical protein
MNRLGVDSAEPKKFELLKKAWEALKTKAKKTIVKMAETKVEAGFKYEYLRVRTDATLLQVVVPEAELNNMHADLVRGNLAPVLKSVQAGKSTLENYLHEERLERTQAWGFSLGIDARKFGGNDTLRKAQVVQCRLDENNQPVAERRSYNGIRSYEGTWGRDKVAWIVDFKAQMEGFSKNKVPVASEFNYGLHFRWQWDERELTRDELERYKDYGVIWYVVDVDDDIADLVKDELAQKKKAVVSVEFKIDHELLRDLLPIAAPTGDEPIAARAKDEWCARSLAKAMPWMKGFGARRILERRRDLYTPLWGSYLKVSDRPLSDYANDAEGLLEKLPGGKEVARFEGRNNDRGHTFAGLIELNGETAGSLDHSGIERSWRHFAHGLKLLRPAVVPGTNQPFEIIEQAFDEMVEFWDQTLLVRAAGVYLLDLVAVNKWLHRVERTMTIKFPDEKKEVTLSTSTGPS